MKKIIIIIFLSFFLIYGIKGQITNGINFNIPGIENSIISPEKR